MKKDIIKMIYGKSMYGGWYAQPIDFNLNYYCINARTLKELKLKVELMNCQNKSRKTEFKLGDRIDCL